MKLNITAKNFELTKGITQFVEEKFERLTKKVDKNTTLHVTLSTSKEGQKAEVMLHVAGQLLKMEAVHSDLYVSINTLIDKVNYQVNKRIEKSNKRTHETIRYAENIKLNEGDEDITMEQKEPIVKRKQFDMKPMMEEEAILQMEMLGHSFFFFFNGETDTMCLLYKRKDGNYGLIESVR
ncbi:ribosome hibernation-promoting factor, HPF/YfiA family [Bacillus sp. M6-12]|uniref:ribosome hibernation-promoting factor, HPF/YfiA family n=1 Tax=Bacillus sp. M6-12 TaxID=2054166 RepID=UPI0015E14455|nr:ribosome-associated translation inhibitor RaiA [Bacillus sp. M6-12]